MFEGNPLGIAVVSDLHVLGSSAQVLGRIPYQYQIVGAGDLHERYSVPEERNSDVVYRTARERGTGTQTSIDFLTDNCPKTMLHKLFRESVYARHQVATLDNMLEKGMISRIPNIQGNSVKGYSDPLTRLNARFGLNIKTPQQHLDGSAAIRQMNNVEYKMVGNSMVIGIPYREKRNGDWDLFRETLGDIVKAVVKYGPENIMIISHENIAPERVILGTKRPAVMDEIMKLYVDTIRQAAPEAKMSMVAGHLHRLVAPFALDNGVTVYSIGWEEATDMFRILLFDPETGEINFEDVKIGIFDEYRDELEALIQEEFESRGYRANVDAELETDREYDGEACDSEGEEGEAMEEAA